MRAVDPNIKIIVNWRQQLSDQKYWGQWEDLIQDAGVDFDIGDVHWYWNSSQINWDNWLTQENPMQDRYWCADCYNDYSPTDPLYLGPSFVEEIQRFHNEVNDFNGTSYDIKLSSLEWNVGQQESVTLSEFQHALMHAQMLGTYINGGLYMATMWPLVWKGGLGTNYRIIFDQENYDPTPSLYVFKLYSNALGQQLITTQTSKAYIRPVCALSNDGNTLWVYLLNKSADGQAVRANVDISGFTAAGAEAIALASPDVFSDIGQLKKLIAELNPQTGKWETVLPPYSLTMLTFHK